MPTITTKFEVGDKVRTFGRLYGPPEVTGTVVRITWENNDSPRYFLETSSTTYWRDKSFPEIHLELDVPTEPEIATDQEVDDLERKLNSIKDFVIVIETDSLRRIIARMDKAESELLDLSIRAQKAIHQQIFSKAQSTSYNGPRI